jgi:hypothetical protein
MLVNRVWHLPRHTRLTARFCGYQCAVSNAAEKVLRRSGTEWEGSLPFRVGLSSRRCGGGPILSSINVALPLAERFPANRWMWGDPPVILFRVTNHSPRTRRVSHRHHERSASLKSPCRKCRPPFLAYALSCSPDRLSRRVCKAFSPARLAAFAVLKPSFWSWTASCSGVRRISHAHVFMDARPWRLTSTE